MFRYNYGHSRFKFQAELPSRSTGLRADAINGKNILYIGCSLCFASKNTFTYSVSIGHYVTYYSINDTMKQKYIHGCEL